MLSPILSIRSATISFAKKLLFEELNLNLFTGDRICLIGKNGAGKTTLMNAIAGRFEIDSGTRWQMPNIKIGYLEQNEKILSNVTIEQYIIDEIKLDDHKSYLVDMICDKLEIDKNWLTYNLSGGQKRRANLAKVLIQEPDLLLLDEPTNHLDLKIIKWLEDYLASYRGALLVISHDRKFLERVSNKVFWLRAGNIKINHHGYKNFDDWSNSIVEQENREMHNLEKKFELESQWLQTGVTGRRKRNIGRLHYLEELKEKIRVQQKIISSNQNKIKIHTQDKFDEDSSQVICSFNNVSMGYDGKMLIKDFNLKIIRGEKIGIIGRNGSGKSTFLKLLIQEIKPIQGTVKIGIDTEFSYFDQQRSILTPEKRIKDVLCENGSDYVKISSDKSRHICGYLKDFLFDPNDTQTLVSTLSGGQQNRLLLAKTLANPRNFLILDEPTNDLDMDSLDILQNYLEKYQGSVLIVSHDRDFLDNTVSSILAFEDDGKINYYLGGYTEYINYKEKFSNSNTKEELSTIKTTEIIQVKPQPKNNKSVGKIRSEINKITQKIERKENEITKLNDELLNFEDGYSHNLAQISIKISEIEKEIEDLEEKWLSLENEIN